MEKTYDEWMTDIESDGQSLLQFIPKQMITYEMCMRSVCNAFESLEFVPKRFKTLEICMKAVESWGLALEFVPKQFKSYEMCMKAIETDGESLQFVPKKFINLDMCIKAVKKDGFAFGSVPLGFRSIKMCKLAMNSDDNCYTIEDIPDNFKMIEISGCEMIEEKSDECMFCLHNEGQWCKLKCNHKFHFNCLSNSLLTKENCQYCMAKIDYEWKIKNK